MDVQNADLGSRPRSGLGLVKWGLALLALALTVWFGLKVIAPSYDSLYSLAWGQMLADGDRPDLFHPLAPLAHPLPIIVSAFLSPLGPGEAYDAFTILAAFSFALLLFSAFRLTRVLVGRDGPEGAAIAAGAFVVLLLVTQVRIDLFAMKATVDVPFTALILLALSYVIEQPRTRPWLPLALLVPAGLLRPESWALGIAYCLWLAYEGLGGRRLVACAALALTPIAGWLLFAAVVAKDPLSPLKGNPEGTSVDVFGFTPPETNSSGGFWLDDTADIVDRAIDNTRGLIGDELAIAGLLVMIGALLALAIPANRTPRRLRVALTTGVVIALVVQSVVLAQLGAPIVERYAFFAGTAIVALIGVAIWSIPQRRVAIAVSALLFALAITGALRGGTPDSPTLPRLREKLAVSKDQRVEQEDLYVLTSVDRVRRAVRPCNKVAIGGRGGVYATLFAKPLIAHGLERDPKLVGAARSPRGKLVASNFRRDLPTGPKPYVEEGLWVFRSPCLQKGYINPRGKISKRYRNKDEKGGTESGKSTKDEGAQVGAGSS